MKSPILTMGGINRASPELGNKVKNIASLAQVGVKVPQGIGLPFELFKTHMASIIPGLQSIREEETGYAAMAKRMQDLVTSSSQETFGSVLSFVKEHMSETKFFAVRSAGMPVVNGKKIAEDSKGISLAGQFESYLFVPVKNIPLAILHCYASLFSERNLARFNVVNDASYLWSQMSVLIQEAYPAELSAVVMTQDPIEGEGCFGIEITYGACEGLVSGEIQGDLYLLEKNSGAIISADIGTKNSHIKYKPLLSWSEDNKISKKTSEKEKACFAAPQSLIRSIYDMGMFVESHFGEPQDIELVVSRGQIVVTQARPITT